MSDKPTKVSPKKRGATTRLMLEAILAELRQGRAEQRAFLAECEASRAKHQPSPARQQSFRDEAARRLEELETRLYRAESKLEISRAETLGLRADMRELRRECVTESKNPFKLLLI